VLVAVSVGREAATNGNGTDCATGRNVQGAGAERTEDSVGRARRLWTAGGRGEQGGAGQVTGNGGVGVDQWRNTFGDRCEPIGEDEWDGIRPKHAFLLFGLHQIRRGDRLCRNCVAKARLMVS
jgi:hypothetical protein